MEYELRPERPENHCAVLHQHNMSSYISEEALVPSLPLESITCHSRSRAYYSLNPLHYNHPHHRGHHIHKSNLS